MHIDQVLARIDQVASVDLPGISAHDAILPAMAKERLKAFEQDDNPRLSGVAATIYPKDSTAHILLIERQSYEGVHSAQVGFPGGKKEEVDYDLKETALREMEEEVGINRNKPQLIRSLSEVYIPPSRFLVHPFLFMLDEAPKLKLDPREVANAIELPLVHIMDDASIVEGSIKMSNGVRLKTPYFEFEDYQIWGATAMMLSELRTLLKEVL